MANRPGPRPPGVPRGGRPRVRNGSEVQVTIEFGLEAYARLCGLVECRKQNAREEKTPVSHESKRVLLQMLWEDYWSELSPSEKRAAKATERYRTELQRGE